MVELYIYTLIYYIGIYIFEKSGGWWYIYIGYRKYENVGGVNSPVLNFPIEYGIVYTVDIYYLLLFRFSFVYF